MINERYERKPFTWLFPALIVIVSALIIGGTMLITPIFNVETVEPEPNMISPKDLPLVTIDMNYDVIYKAFNDAQWCDVSEGASFILTGDYLRIGPKGDKASYNAIVPPSVASETARLYPRLFGYEEDSGEFTMYEAKKKKGAYVKMPAWLVEGMIRMNVLCP